MKRSIFFIALAYAALLNGISGRAQAPLRVSDFALRDGQTIGSTPIVYNNTLWFFADTLPPSGGALGFTAPWTYDEHSGPVMRGWNYPITYFFGSRHSGGSSAAMIETAVMQGKLYASARVTFLGTVKSSSTILVYDGVNAFAPLPGMPPLDSATSSIRNLTAAGGKLYFVISSGTQPQYSGLWCYDGASAPSRIMPSSGIIRGLAEHRGKLYFSAIPSGSVPYLYELNPSSNSFYVVKSTGYPNGISNPWNLYSASNGKLYFLAGQFFNSGPVMTGQEIYSFDGTDIKRLNQEAEGSYVAVAPICYFAKDNSVYFYGTNGTDTGQLFRIGDGGGVSLAAVIDSTQSQLADLYNSYSGISNMIAYGDKLFFSARTNASGTELWRYDGTTASMIADIWPGSKGGMGYATNVAGYAGYWGSKSSAYFCIYNHKLYFPANDSVHGQQLWRLDDPTGVPHLASAPGDILSAYPNPVSNMLHVSGAEPGNTYEITDVSGRVLRQGLMPATRQLAVESLAPGMYVLRVYGAQAALSLRFVKQ